MENWENNDQRIDAYLMDRLNPQERTNFEAALQTDSDLAKEVEHRRLALKAIDLVGRHLLKEKLETIHRQVDSTPARRVPLYAWGALAAGLALLLAALFWWGTNDSPDNLFAAYYQTPNISAGSRGGTAELSAAKAAAAKAFEAENYDAAIAQYRILQQQNPQDPFLSFALGLSYLESGNYAQAVATLQDIIQDEDLLYMHQALWYQALCFIKSDKLEAAERNLQKLAVDPLADFHEQALELMEKLPAAGQ